MELASIIDQYYDAFIAKYSDSALPGHFNAISEAYFEFITTPKIDPTNNIAEQAIRFIVIDRYVTQGTRSEKGRKSCERIWTVIATCALQNRSAFNFILEAVNACFQNQRAPSLLPAPEN